MTTRPQSPKPARRTSRRPEALTAAEAEEWRRFAAGVAPLRRGRAPAPPPEPPVAVPAPVPGPVPGPVPAVAPPPAASAPAPARRPPAPLEINRHPPGVDNTRWTGLAKGRMRPERRLDLHGMTLMRAHDAVAGFLRAASLDGCRVVEIVTGLGERGEGAIRREFMHWLNAPDLRRLVLAAAHPHRANAGAVRLLLRRAPGR